MKSDEKIATPTEKPNEENVSEPPPNESITAPAEPHSSNNVPVVKRRRIFRPFFIRVYVISSFYILHAVFQFVLIQLLAPHPKQLCHIVLLLIALSLMLFILFISMEILQKGPWKWLMSIFIAVICTYGIALTFVPDAKMKYVLINALVAYLLLCLFIASGRFVDKMAFPPATCLIMLTGTLVCVLLIFLICVRSLRPFYIYEIYLIRCWVILLVFPICIFQSHVIHGHYTKRLPLKELPLICLILLLDFYVIFLGLYWSPVIAESQRNFLARKPK